MNRYLALIIAHILADFPLQAGVIYTWKTQSKFGLGIHTLIHLFVFYIIFEPPRTWWPALVFLLIMHYFIDWIKLRFPIRPQLIGFILDQFWHILSLIPIAVVFKEMVPAIPNRYLILDFLVALTSPLLLMFWTYSQDMNHLKPGDRFYGIIDWAQDNLLRWSQVAGFIGVAVVMLHLLET